MILHYLLTLSRSQVYIPFLETMQQGGERDVWCVGMRLHCTIAPNAVVLGLRISYP